MDDRSGIQKTDGKMSEDFVRISAANPGYSCNKNLRFCKKQGIIVKPYVVDGSRAMRRCEPCQVRKEAAVSILARVLRFRLFVTCGFRLYTGYEDRGKQ